MSAGKVAAIQATIRPVTAEDAEALAKFFVENDVPAVTRYFHPFPLTRETALHIARGPSKDHFYVAAAETALAGFCMLRGWDEGFDIPSFGVFVDHRLQRAGLGRRMTEFAVEQARALGCRSVRLTVDSSNTHALDLYRSLGFDEVSRKIALAAGQEEESVVMNKLLS